MFACFLQVLPSTAELFSSLMQKYTSLVISSGKLYLVQDSSAFQRLAFFDMGTKWSNLGWETGVYHSYYY